MTSLADALYTTAAAPATLHVDGRQPKTIEVPVEGMLRDEFLEAASVNIAAASSKGVSFQNQDGDTLNSRDRVMPGDSIHAVSNRENG